MADPTTHTVSRTQDAWRLLAKELVGETVGVYRSFFETGIVMTERGPMPGSRCSEVHGVCRGVSKCGTFILIETQVTLVDGRNTTSMLYIPPETIVTMARISTIAVPSPVRG